MSTRPRASVIIRTLNAERTLPRALASLREQTVRPEIIIVDSGSSDGTLGLVEGIADQIVTVTPDDFTFGRALNLGAQAARAPVHFALSSHCAPARADWIERALSHYGDKRVAATNGQDRYPDGRPLNGVFVQDRTTKLTNPFWTFSNHAASWRAEVWEEFPFDEAMVAAEDAEWSHRVRQAGWVIVFDRALFVSSRHRREQGLRALMRRTRNETLGYASFSHVEQLGSAGALRAWWTVDGSTSSSSRPPARSVSRAVAEDSSAVAVPTTVRGRSTPSSRVPVVGHVVDQYLPTTETFIYTQLRFQQRARPVVLARRTANLDRFPIASVKVLRGPPPVTTSYQRLNSFYARVYWRMHARGLISAARASRCDLLHAHFGAEGYHSLRAAEGLGVPLVTTFYGFDLALPSGDREWTRRYTELFAEGARFCVEGPAMAKTLQALGAPVDRIRVVPIGIDLAHFPYRPPRRDGKLVVFQAARFTDKKGFDLSIRAFASARDELPDAELWLVGDGPLRTELESLAEELRIGDAVRFLGLVDHARYRELLEGAHIAIQPSRTAADGDTEGGAPTVLLEYQARGIPYVATRHADIPFVSGNPELLVDEEDSDGLAEMLVRLGTASDQKLDEIARNGLEHVRQRHDASRVAETLAAVYEEALQASETQE
jgi:glycosyltransferase involved in cell wall biosynthesis